VIRTCHPPNDRAAVKRYGPPGSRTVDLKTCEPSAGKP
jgi:hypothetical protein